MSRLHCGYARESKEKGVIAKYRYSGKIESKKS